MAYVPPALRKKQEAAQAALPHASNVEPPADTGPVPRRDLPDVHDIYDHFHPVDLAAQSAGGTDAVNSTLHSSSFESGKLKYAILFVDANPRWSSDKIIFAKSNLHLLPGAPRKDSATVEEEQKPGSANAEDGADKEQQQTPDQQNPDQDAEAPTKPHESTIEPNLGAIAVFEQVGSRMGGMRFIGYHKLTRIQFLEPRSVDLVRMLEQKWSIPDKYGHVRQIRRDSDKWLKSMGYRWAVLKFEDDAEANATLDPPDVKINAERELVPKVKKERKPQKSVNELLRELRLGKDNQGQLDGEADAASEDNKPT
ncbi:uncharacterized protein J3D65DRAFT_13136 [Phyllosticta citribraziliensis]|uniref:Uncharacterized protein n=1 Tax=Phyllosticta citribraziliensis TaxID=989973 RepID=A0ABR1M8T0_9PEZI